jgi:uncharacterized protein YcfJ
MKRGLIASIPIPSISITMLMLGHAISVSASDSSYDYAKVLRSEPITRIVRVSTPRQECWDEAVTYRDYGHSSHDVSRVVGALLGGALGNAVGHSNTNKKVGAVVGAVLGGTLGHAHATRHHRSAGEYTAVEERCEIYQDYEEHEKVIGYRVTYRYNGKVYTTRTDTAPGESIRVRVTVSAA